MNLELSAVWTRVQNLLQSFIVTIPNILIGLLVFVIFLLVAGLARSAVSKLAERTGQPKGIALVFSRIVSWLVIGVGVLVALTVVFPTLTAASLFGALGVSGVAIGFAFKDIFQNLLAGILILITRPFRIGDQIVSGSHEGVVEDIQVRATLLRTYDNRRVVIPNSELYTTRVAVNTAYPQRRLAVTVGIGYGDDIAAARKLILDTLHGLDGLLQDPAPSVLVKELGDFSVNLEVRFWIDPPIRKEAVETQDTVLEAIKNALPAAGFDLPFPTQQVLWHDQTETTDGDRTQQREGWPARKANPPSRQQAQREAQGEEQQKAGVTNADAPELHRAQPQEPQQP
ncbi:mechanosensitive ion channel family protein [Deinococcus arenicola]|uniref:Mechanosensitive ion channel family protein n=1 Tax=Deinococcus arenicola TaxID=2994950 RepID=A0ABU4DML1_9DEIO|nr:mechanosensitive ion channel family protein [Deinococcus sp. ZS9-10]MDV6373130.1 mechanosensitive ion channel family protein [Deinococcus sp. ZS9-10]